MINEAKLSQEYAPDTEPPSDERQSEIQQSIQANQDRGRPPCAGITIKTLGELSWIIDQQNWTCGIDPGSKSRPDLRAADFTGTLLGGVNLSGSDLRDARLTGADLSGATLFGVKLSQADLRRARLIEAFLPDVDLTDADCERTNFHNASLVGARLSGAYLEQADLTGADVWSAQCSATTVLRGVGLDTRTRLGDILWNGAPLTQINWHQVKTLGDEDEVSARVTQIRQDKSLSRKERRQRVAATNRDVARAYRALSIALRQQGMTDVASDYRLREQQYERAALKAEHRPLALLWSRLLYFVAGYGERPLNALLLYAATVISFMGVYLLITHHLDTHLSQLSWDEALVLSITSFHGRGFFPGT
ncbi:MAG TPA: pentapeptide repeat-containing protein, partial [Ktedonobacterales bacterium]